MELLSAILLVLSPWIVKGITNLVKKIDLVRFLNSASKTYILRFVVAILAFVAAWGTSALNGTPLDGNVIQTLAEAVIVFLGSTGAYFFEKLKAGKVA
jgi:hypothetical protein